MDYKNVKLKTATRVVCKQGIIPFTLNDTAIEIINIIVGNNIDELDFISSFSEMSSQTVVQLVTSSGFNESKIIEIGDRLAEKGLVFNQPNSSRVMVYRLLPFMAVGLMEYMFMREIKYTEEEKRLAVMFGQMLQKLNDQTQKNYDKLIPQFENMPPIDRTVPPQKNNEGKSIKTISVKKRI